MEKKFSVLMAVYAKECPDFFDTALGAVFDQTVRPAEVVLVEDGPLTPELEAVVEKYKLQYPQQLRVVVLPVHKGIGFAANVGLEQCTHELIARADSDDISKPTRFEEQLNAFAGDPDLAVVGNWVDRFSTNPSILDGTRVFPEYDNQIKRLAKSSCPMAQATVMFRKSAVMEAGGYRDLRFGEDYDLWVRLILNGAKFYNIPQSLILYRTGGGVFARRGGWSYAVNEVKLLRGFYNMGFCSYPLFLRNVLTRLPVRLMPNWLRAMFYRVVLKY